MQVHLNSRETGWIPEHGIQQQVILLHGLMGTLSNWEKTVARFSGRYKVYTPQFPLFDSFMTSSHLNRLVTFLEDYIQQHQLVKPVLIGNSLGGHIALLYALKHPDNVAKLVLTGSSGLYEHGFGGSFPRVKDYAYIDGKVKEVFEKKEVVDTAMVDHVYAIVQHKLKVLSIIGIARDAQRQNLSMFLPALKLPVLLIWGKQDRVTPPKVAEEFKRLIPNSRLVFINDCGDVPMMEHPELFNEYVSNFLEA